MNLKNNLATLDATTRPTRVMLKHLDDSVGEIRATLEASGLAKNTVLIFTSETATGPFPFRDLR